MNELWKQVPRYSHCEVSSTGRVRYKSGVHLHGLTKKERPLKLGGFGYYQVTIDGRTESVHNLVAEAFIGPRPSSGHRIDHINERKLDNRPENLRWLPHGFNTVRSKFTGGRRYFYEGELWLMKKLIVAGIAYWKIGKMFKCSTMLVQDAKKGLKDNHIKG